MRGKDASCAAACIFFVDMDDGWCTRGMETRADGRGTGRDDDRSSSSGSVLNLYGYRVLDGRCGAGREVKRRRRWNRERGTDGRDARSLFYST